eukprot:TRINITY_DN19328_c0_g1_i1.p1 TRINITY_DN19328_c0_g1~~TRINITY_DN19328_c0_g1_i1.p1  ORF type:complete len:118 (+),score=26.29 TRINITY_DN19328_c0_g1_i1:70-423(+)
MAVNPLRREVLKLYRTILKTASDWSSSTQQQTLTEREYIQTEARKQFRINKHISNTNKIQERITEARLRLELSLHYRNPYPRPISYPSNFVPVSRGRNKTRMFQQSIPAYLKSSVGK